MEAESFITQSERDKERERGTYPRNKVQKWFTQRFSKGKVFLLLFLFKWVLVRWGKKLKKEGCYNRSKVSVKAMVVLFVFSCSTVHHFFCLACAIRIDGDCGASNSEIARKSKQKQKRRKNNRKRNTDSYKSCKRKRATFCDCATSKNSVEREESW